MIESADLHKYLPSRVELCSSQVGWRSLLLRHQVQVERAVPLFVVKHGKAAGRR